MKKLLLFLLEIQFLSAGAQIKTPLDLYPRLFKDVQMHRVYPDSKTFPDAIPLKAPAQINAAYLAAVNQPGFDLRAFVYHYFKPPAVNSVVFKSDIKKGLRNHIDTLWAVLKRNSDTAKGTSLLPLPHPYIVPGGRFREIYYWDSYFTMLGLQQDKKYGLIKDMIDNFAWLLDKYGLIPNGNRTYYLTRSQPPYFSLMVALLAQKDGKKVFKKYLPEMVREYQFWMKGAASLKPGTAFKHVVKLGDGTLLNRYWDDDDQPREESYREDVLTAVHLKQRKADFYRNIRAAAESGWDFSSRWFADGEHLNTIQTTDLIPVDLNCLLFHLENTIALGYRLSGNTAKADFYTARALKRKNAIINYCWNRQQQCFTDYNWKTRTGSAQVTIATAYPLFFKIASPIAAQMVTTKIKNSFLQTGGVSTTIRNTGQQWDRPNGWAPLQYMTIQGLRNYGKDSLAKAIALRCIKQNTETFNQTGKLLEKYNIELRGKGAYAGGGEYPLQDGFGWTNGVLLTLMNEYGIK